MRNGANKNVFEKVTDRISIDVEGLGLLIYGLGLPFLMAGSYIFGYPPDYVVAGLSVLWIIGFTSWAVRGGMPPRYHR